MDLQAIIFAMWFFLWIMFIIFIKRTLILIAFTSTLFLIFNLLEFSAFSNETTLFLDLVLISIMTVDLMMIKEEK